MKKYLAILLLLCAVSAHAAISWAGWCVTTTAATGTGTSFSQWITTTAAAIAAAPLLLVENGKNPYPTALWNEAFK